MSFAIPQSWSEAYEFDKSVIYAMDADLRITRCNAAWDEFALANGAPEMVRARVTGIHVLDVVPEVLRDFYRTAYEVVLRCKWDWWHLFECPSPSVARSMHMRISPFGDGLLILNSVVREESLEVAFQRAVQEYIGEDGFAKMCANCRRTRNELHGSWDWVPKLLVKSRSLIVLVLCPTCRVSMSREETAFG